MSKVWSIDKQLQWKTWLKWTSENLVGDKTNIEYNNSDWFVNRWKTRDYKFQGADLFGGIHSNTSQIQGSNCRVLTTSSHLNNQFSISTSWQFFIQ